MARLWPAAVLLALLLPGCFSVGFEGDFDDGRDERMEDEHFFWMVGPMAGFLLFVLIVTGVVLLIVNLSSRPAQPPPAPPQQAQEETEEAKPARRR